MRSIKDCYETELFERVLPFWERHAPDTQHGGTYNCLARDGAVYDTTKHVWLQGRLAWLFAKLYRTVEQKPAWLDLARGTLRFLQEHAHRPEDDRVYFSLTEAGQPVYLQRKIFSECFYVMALAEVGRAAEEPDLLAEAKRLLAKLFVWAEDWSHVGRPSFPGEPAGQMLAVPMILLNLIEEVAGDDWADYRVEVDSLLKRALMHVDDEKKIVREHVGPDGEVLPNAHGRLVNPGHAIECGWFILHWALRLDRPELRDRALQVIRWSHDAGWDRTLSASGHERGGLLYFMDADGHNPVQLEAGMKLWWPHCEALYAHLLAHHVTASDEDRARFDATDAYTFRHFPDAEHGEWYGYLSRDGVPTHTFKGGPYKGCFHVPRSLFLCWRLLSGHAPV